ncbi:MAG: DUF6491 family protein [Rhodospirillaceae bacterium]|nr:DUF6491 family protein [Rhodospirillaceae bacterium]
MKSKLFALALLAAAAPALAQPAAPEQASIPFFDHDAIRDWRADGNRALYIEGSGRQWYYGELMGPCLGLDFAHTIAFAERPGTSFDRFGSIIVKDGPAGSAQTCRLKSLVKSEKPAGKAKAGAD